MIPTESQPDSAPLPKADLGSLAFTALIYCTLGAIGISFASAPGYASPIFPAAGFAVAAMLWTRRGAWPAIWVGSFVMNAGLSLLQGHWGMRSTMAAAGIATGATLQALLAAWLITRYAGDCWRRMEAERETVWCLILAGPLACGVSASFGIFTLLSTGLVSLSDAPYALLNWWLGDVLGVLIMLPLSLALKFRDDSLWRNRLLAQVLPMSVVLALVAGAFYTVTRWEQSQEQLRVEKHGENVAQLLRQRFVAHQEALASLRRLVEVTPQMTYARFEYFTRITLKDNPDIFALSVNPYVTREQRSAFERGMRQFTPDFEIRERDAERRLIRALEREDYVTVGLIAPLRGNAAAVGFDINSDPIRSDAIARARASSAPAITAPIQLVQENIKRPGVLVLHPAFRMESTAPDDRNPAQLLAFAVGVIKVDEMMAIATRDLSVSGLSLRLEDQQAAPDRALLYQLGDPAGPNQPAAWQGQIAVADRAWTLSVYPTAAYLQHQRHWLALLVGSSGLVLAALFQVLLLGTTGRTSVVERTVKRQTSELEARGQALEDRNAQLDALFTLSPDGFVAIDHGGIIRFVNPAFQTMTGIVAKDILGSTEAVLQAELKLRSQLSGLAPSTVTTFRTFGEGIQSSLLQLKIPRNTVIQMVAIQSDSPGVGRIVYFRDITAETEVDHLKSEFLSTAAHELRTPMASVYGFAELLMTQPLDDAESRELLGIIHRQSKLMADILNELLDLARIEERRGKDFEFVQLPIRTLVQDALEGFKLPPDRQGVLTSLPKDNRSIVADRQKASQALVNVLSNAFKYSPRGGPVTLECVESPDAAGNPRIGLRVTDNGIGMTQYQVSRIFERFYRADTSGKIPGTGLGMSIVKEIVELHAGSVTVDSAPERGTTVTLWFPAPLMG